jgi:multisubunit Na+/H+ antiporter MnhB subunit
MGVETFAVILIAFMLLAALVAVEAKDLLSSVIAVGAAGFALSVLDLLLGAPDLAITQVVVEVIALVLLIRVVVTRDDTSRTASRDVLRTGAALLAAGLVLAAVFAAVGGFGGGQEAGRGVMPPFGRPVLSNKPTDPVPPGASRAYLGDADKLREKLKAFVPPEKADALAAMSDREELTGALKAHGLSDEHIGEVLASSGGSAQQTGAANAVMGVLLDYRAYDTLGEATVIFVSVLGAYAVLRRVGRRRREGEAEPPQEQAP